VLVDRLDTGFSAPPQRALGARGWHDHNFDLDLT
jgi:hypothetical protein